MRHERGVLLILLASLAAGCGGGGGGGGGGAATGGGGAPTRQSADLKGTNASLFAYVADGAGGLWVVQLTSPETVPGYLGFSPRPEPRILAHRKTHGPALALSKGLDRDRAADESGNQVSIFNRLGSRPFNLGEMQRLYLRDGAVFTVTDDPPGAPVKREDRR